MKQRRGIRSPRPRKVVIRAGIFLLLGAIVNIAVAWGCALWLCETETLDLRPEHFVLGISREQDALILWTVEVHESSSLSYATCGWTNATREDSLSCRERDPQELLPGWAQYLDLRALREAEAAHGQSGHGTVVGRGWPLISLTCECGYLSYPPYYVPSESVDLGWPGGSAAQVNPPADRWLPRLLPLRLYGPGFAINTLFYAAILWLLLALPRALRRWRRIKRGLCPACAYPVGASDFCTECGGLLPSSRSVTTPS